MIIEARDVTARYHRAARPALAGVSCAVEQAGWSRRWAPTGAARRRSCAALSGLLPLERGSVRVAGRDVAAWPRHELARVVGVLPQREDILFPLRVDETVMLGRYAHLGPLAATGEPTGPRCGRRWSGAT